MPAINIKISMYNLFYEKQITRFKMEKRMVGRTIITRIGGE